ncbi:MAG TPA: serine/threonine-protein kinase, partial [Candidatus Acidoferrales bacterium]|nr:serine/threonine-protein kinase [Candidatus Acidoferrales bacterium]
MRQIGRYHIVEELGQGAMGAVYKASDPMMDRVVAVKTILSTALSGPLAGDYRERFFREARAAGRLAHPGIVTVYDVAEQEGTPFLVMEFIQGHTLEKIMETGERFDESHILEFGQQIAEALDYAHKSGVIHRDIKPANIMITADGRPKITDFGVAKLAASQVTTTGQLMGTPAFMAPEQFTGARVDGRADLFALGVILYWLATGDRPFTGETLMAMSYKIVHTDPVPPRKLNPGIPRDFENVILKCMEKDPAARYQSGEALARDLRAMREGRALDTLNRDRLAAAAGVEKTALSTAPPMVSDLAEDAMDTAETIAVVQPKSRIAAPPASPRSAVAQQPAVSATRHAGGEHASRRMWLVFAAVIVVALLAAAVLKKLSANVVTTTPPQQAAQGSVTGPANIPAPVAPPAAPGPGFAGEPPDVLKDKADAERTAEKVRKESAKIAADAKHATGLNLELTATERAMVVLTPDHGPAASYQMQPGNSVSAKAEQEMKLFTDNAGALQWKMNGKTQPSLGTGHVAASARITPAGAETLWSGDAAAMARKFGKTRPPQGPEAPGAAVANGVDASRIRREVGQQVRAGMVPLRIELRGIPLMLEVFVQID